MSQILLDPHSRVKLAKWLKNKVKPPDIAPLQWNLLLMGKLACVDFKTLSCISDKYGCEWMEIIRATPHQEIEFSLYGRVLS